MKPTLFLLTTLIVLFSCSSDPCEGVSCVNGDCDDGSCACDVGWTGEFCDQIDFNYIGSYKAVSITYSQCDDGSDNGVWPADSDRNFCYLDGSKSICFSYNLDIKSDGTFKQFWIDTEIDGGFTTSTQDPAEGTYEIKDAEITLCSPSWTGCEKLVVNTNRTGLDWKITNKGNSGCFRTYSILKN